MFPEDSTVKNEALDDEATLNIVLISPLLPTMLTRDEVDVVPILRAESQPAPINIAVSVAEPPVIEEILTPIVVPVATPDPIAAKLTALNIPPGA